MTIWSLTTDTDGGMFCSLYPTEEAAYSALISNWFSDDDAEDRASTAAALSALTVGIQPCIDWFCKYIERSSTCDSYAVDRHDIEWGTTLTRRESDNLRAALRVYQYATDDALDAVPADLFPGHARLLDADMDVLCARLQRIEEVLHG